MVLQPKAQTVALLELSGMTKIRQHFSLFLMITFAFILTTQNGIRISAAEIAQRMEQNPLITPQSGDIGNNINGPSVIKAPTWLPKRLNDYYMYFADHNGAYIRLATAPHPSGPWKVEQQQILPIKALNKSGFSGHIASPDVHIDHVKQDITLYFHAPARWDPSYKPFIRSKFSQLTGVAAAEDGLNFYLLNEQPLSLSYLRVFEWNGRRYGLSARALAYREHKTSWPRGENPWQERGKPLGSWRHCALHVEGDRLFVFYTRWGDKPERIVASYINLVDDWDQWELSPQWRSCSHWARRKVPTFRQNHQKKVLQGDPSINYAIRFSSSITTMPTSTIALPENRAYQGQNSTKIGNNSFSTPLPKGKLIKPIRSLTSL